MSALNSNDCCDAKFFPRDVMAAWRLVSPPTSAMMAEATLIPGTISGSVLSAANTSPLATLFSSRAERKKRTRFPGLRPLEAPFPSRIISAFAAALGSTSLRLAEIVVG